MSSHHIVRENQEPALLIQHFHALDRDMLDQLLEWSPTIIVDEFQTDYLLSEEIKIDVIFSRSVLPDLQEQTKLQPLVNSFLEDSLTYLVSNSYSAVNILCETIDPLIMTFAPHINIVTLSKKRRYVFIQGRYEKWKPKGEKIYVDASTVESFEGLNIIDNLTFETKDSGFFRLEFNSTDFICIGEDL